MILGSISSAGDAKRFNEAQAYREPRWQVGHAMYRNRQWAVTDYGIENICGPYHYCIAKSDLSAKMGSHRTWIDHMSEKTWVDTEAFEAAFNRAREIFN